MGQMSSDRFKFYLPQRYFQSTRCPSSNGMFRETCQRILKKAFSMSTSESANLMEHNPLGFTILCRPSQFARFIFFRAEADECINGIKDLRLERLVDYKDRDPYDEIADAAATDRGTVRRVLAAVGYGVNEGSPRPTLVNVSKRPRDER